MACQMPSVTVRAGVRAGFFPARVLIVNGCPGRGQVNGFQCECRVVMVFVPDLLRSRAQGRVLPTAMRAKPSPASLPGRFRYRFQVGFTVVHRSCPYPLVGVDAGQVCRQRL